MDLVLYLLVLLNPFAQMLYLASLIESLSVRDFARVHLLATLLSLAVFTIFLLGGDFILTDVFRVRLESLQIFGGLIMLFVAYQYFARGAGSNLLFRGAIEDLAPEISLPYMVGPGTIWMCILLGERLPMWQAFSGVVAVLAVNFLFLVGCSWVYSRIAGRKQTLLAKYFAILMRTNALFIGAIAVEMLTTGLRASFDGTLTSLLSE